MALEARWFLEATESRKQFRGSLIWVESHNNTDLYVTFEGCHL